MAHEIVYDTKQLERLSGELAALPRDLLLAIRSSLVSGITDSMQRVVPKYYAFNPKTHRGTFKTYTRGVRADDTEGVSFEVRGRRLTLSHFNFEPKRHGARPIIEVIKGQSKLASVQTGADGKPKTPFVMSTGARGNDKVRQNVFILTGQRQKANKNKEALRSYRTVSVPQMLEHPRASDDIGKRLLHVFDQTLFRRIESRTGVMQSNISR